MRNLFGVMKIVKSGNKLFHIKPSPILTNSPTFLLYMEKGLWHVLQNHIDNIIKPGSRWLGAVSIVPILDESIYVSVASNLLERTYFFSYLAEFFLEVGLLYDFDGYVF